MKDDDSGGDDDDDDNRGHSIKILSALLISIKNAC